MTFLASRPVRLLRALHTCTESSATFAPYLSFLHHLHPLILELLRLCFDFLQEAAHPRVRAVQEVQQVILPLPPSITMVLVLLGDKVLDRFVALALPRLGLLNPIDRRAHVVERCGSIAVDGLQIAADLHDLDLGMLHHLREAHLRLGELDVQLVQQVRLLRVQVLELGLHLDFDGAELGLEMRASIVVNAAMLRYHAIVLMFLRSKRLPDHNQVRDPCWGSRCADMCANH